MKEKNESWFFLSVLLLGMLTACTHLSVQNRQQIAYELVKQAGWDQQILSTPYFPLRAYLPTPKPVSTLTIYIGGDGLAWINRSTSSSDPTPMNPLALKLALADNIDTNVAYLARPCQYVRNALCKRRYWTSARFAPQVIVSMDAAVSSLKKQFHAKSIQFVGYSGGGAVAALVAARRHDVSRLITVAGNLDHQAWTRLHHVSPLSDSLNAADFWQKLVDIPQIHFVGGSDHNMPLIVAESYRHRFPVGHKPKIKVINSADHHCCWVNQWPALLKIINVH